MIRVNPKWRYNPFGRFDTCPQCLGTVTPVPARDQVNFYCEACNSCWHVSMGYLRRFDPATCPGIVPRQRVSDDASTTTATGAQPAATSGRG